MSTEQKRCNSRWKLALVCFFLFLFSPVVVLGASKQTKTVRVAYPIQPGITDLDSSGSHTGYTYEYLSEVAQYTGWNYEFVQVGGTETEQISKLMEMVKKGEIDLMGATIYNEEVNKNFLFSRYSYGTVETVLQIPSNSRKEILIDATANQTIKIAVASTKGRLIDDLREYCEMNKITPILVECKNEYKMRQALRDGSADVILNTSMNYINGVRTIASFSPRQFYFVTSRDDREHVLPELNEAMDKIYHADPYFQTGLYEKYFAPQRHELVLSEEEEEYIGRAGAFRVGVLINQPPVQYEDQHDGEVRGIGVDLLDHISSKTGLKFKMLKARTPQELYDMAHWGQVDIVAGMLYNYDLASEQKISMSRPYISSQYVLLLGASISQDNMEGKRLALVSSSPYRDHFLGGAVYFDTIGECLAAVRDGRADYTYVDSYTAQYYMNQPAFDNFKMVPQSYSPWKVSFGFAAPVDSNLLSIINKVILSIPEEEMQSIVYMNTLQSPGLSFGDFIKRNPLEVILIVAGVFLLIFFLLLVLLLQRSRANKASQLELKRHLRLYALSNDAIFEYDFKKRKLMLSMPEEWGSGQKISNYNMGETLEEKQAEESRLTMRAFLEDNDNGVYERRLVGPDGTWHWYRVIMERICDDLGKPVYAIGRLNVIDEEHIERDSLLKKAQRDSMSGLYNAGSCKDMTQQRLAGLPEGQMGALVVLDIDFFKHINDTYGHMKGDEVIQTVAKTLQKNFRADDIIGRPGGDEFMVYMPHVQDLRALEEKCGAVCQKIREIKLDSGEHLTISMGVAPARAKDEYDVLYRAADQAMYEVKEKGRDGFKIVECGTTKSADDVGEQT